MFDYVPVDYSSTKPDVVSIAPAGRAGGTALTSFDSAFQPGETVALGLGEFIRRVDEGTLTPQELRHRETAGGMEPVSSPVSDDMFRNRMSLLVQQHGGVKSRENAARLRMLTERIRELSPSVDDAQLDALSEIVGQTEATSDRLAQIRQRFNLRA
jgi:hypothetical protein